MHHGPEMSSVSLLIQPFSITPTLMPSRDEEEEEEEKRGKEEEEDLGGGRGKRGRGECESNYDCVRDYT